MNEKTKHQYLLPGGTTVDNQKEGCIKLGIGRNAFRNRVKSGIIKKVMNDRPKGYYENNKSNS